MFKDYLYITGLAFRDIAHERILSFCMALSLGAIFTPIIILLGLQQGIIGNMLDTLASDPASRLVRPKFMIQSPMPNDSLEVIKKAGVEFIPSETSHLLLNVKGLADSINVVPSSKKDPFVIQSDHKDIINNTNWVVISESLSKQLGKKQGDNLTLLLKRTANSNYPEEVPLDFKIVGILSTKLMPDLKIYLPVTVFNGIYHWRKGYAVSSLGLKGNRADDFTPEYDGVITGFSKKPSDGIFRQMLAGRLPFSTMPEKYQPFIIKHDDWLLWETVNSTITDQDIDVLNNSLLNHGYAPKLIPYVKGISLELNKSTPLKKWDVYMLSRSESPKWNKGDKPILFVSSGDKQFLGNQSVILKTGLKNNNVVIPVKLKVSKNVPSGKIVASHHFAGLLRSAKRLGANYNNDQHEFVLRSRDQIRYFRVYAKSIEQLDSLVKVVKNGGDALNLDALKEPVSKLYEVQKIRTLSDYMKKIYFLIAFISAVSTIFAVSSSVYASVQRRKKDLAYLNMLGIDKITIIFFPLMKSMILISIGIAIAFLGYWFFSIIASHWFVGLLGETESLTRLPASDILFVIGSILSLGGISSLSAGLFVSRIDSKRYIHE
ncbi:ABC transporter permease [Photobacterium toruni]|uniref:ABC transporter permease n=1 Tax=Photobacterium toruni TaxID=1935446 RepID=UPI002E199484|nr:ABC transporter permease [Photobacterium toruni]